MVSKPKCSLIVKIWFFSTIIHFSSSYQHHDLVSRPPRSIKTTFDKEPIRSGGKVVAEIQNKISSLETSVQSLNDEISKAQSSNDQLNESLQEQAALLENLENEFASIENLLSNHTNLLDQIKYTVQPDPNEKTFIYSNETCGQVLNAQSGYVSFSRPSSQTLKSSCVWIIQANYHSLIKLTTKVPTATYTGISPPRVDAYVVELLINQSTFQTKVTKLLQGTKLTYSFKGPLIYVVLSFENNYDYYGSFEFHFESYGQRIRRDTVFSHKIYNNPIFEITQQLDSQDFYMSSTHSPKKYISEFGSIVISNFTSKLHLLLNWNKESCSTNSFIGVLKINNILDTSTNQNLLENLCNNSTEAASTKLLTSLGKSVVIFIAKPFDSQLPFNLTWTIAIQYPSSFRYYGYGLSTNQYTCGSVLSGTSGVIYYKYSTTYRNGERCLWIILPQNPEDQIDLYFSHSSLTSTSEMPVYDYVYVMEINTTSTPPKLDRIQIFTEFTRNYTAISAPVYLLFYSDSAVPHSGFMINWQVRGRNSGDDQTVENGIAAKFNFFREHSGKMNIIPVKNDFYDTLYQIFVFVPSLPSTTREGFGTPNYIFGMNLEFNCVTENFTVFTLTDHYPLRREVNNSQCNGEGKIVLKNVDGMAILILKTIKDDNRVVNSTMNFSWIQEVPENDTNVIKMENNRCGGVIIGKRGILRYKTSLTNIREGDLLNKDDHCLWLLQSPNSTQITVKVLKDGSTSLEKSNFLIASLIDVDSGTLNYNSVGLRSRRGHVGENYEQVFNDSLLVISFRPNENSANGTGFLLQFWGNDDTNNQTGSRTSDNPIEYRLRHSDAKSGRFLYEWGSQHSHNPGKQLHVIAYSVTNPVHVTTQPIPTNVNWTLGIFKRNSGEPMTKCIYDSISFYSTRRITAVMPDNRYSSYIWKQHVTFPQINSTLSSSSSSSTHSCPNQIKVTSQQNLLTTNNYAFLIIYKLVGSPVHSEDDRKIDFVHKQIIPAARPAPEELEKDDDDDDYFLPGGYTSYPWSRGYTASEREVLRRVLQYRNRYHNRHHNGFG